ncbi:MAG: hypothetical protein J7623_04175 [Chitinophaga sp.]|uniref:hypothetical protein n=1 Tax=Chitinophaga sp. TaxID=1869181 RepID=UPI001B09C6BA|nr:hypothetical protein [Chitinophaga sp.]MBO9727813.1 hypothetical protein [Chitinophaga sp.]
MCKQYSDATYRKMAMTQDVHSIAHHAYHISGKNTRTRVNSIQMQHTGKWP